MADKTPVEIIADAVVARLTDCLGHHATSETKADMRSGTAAYIAALEVGGYRIIAMEPTDAMVEAASDTKWTGDPNEDAATFIRSAIAAAPTWGKP